MSPRLLVVDDERGFSDFVQLVAEEMGFAVTALNDSTKFRETFAAVQPDIIILDIVMPDVDGIEIIRWLSEQAARSRIILVSGYTPNYAEAAQVIATASGVVDVRRLRKPTPLAEMREALAA